MNVTRVLFYLIELFLCLNLCLSEEPKLLNLFTENIDYNNMTKLILVTGAAGYVGSHCLIELLNSGYDVVVVDNCVNAVEPVTGYETNSSMPESLRRVENITGRSIVKFYKVDINDHKKLEEIFSNHKFEAVMHFAALKAVGESGKIPLEYYRNNVGGTLTLLETMRKFGVKKFIFSSSATVYGYPDYLPIDENHHTGRNCTNPYGKTKYFIEEILKDLCDSEKGWSVTSLRYFNPVGAHESGEIGEDPQGIPNNLMPFISQVAVGRHQYLKVFGNDFKTIDGTGVRDYIHIMDLASGHVITLDKILEEGWTGWNVYNLGAGTGYSVIAAFEESTGVNIPYKICDRRFGDVDELWADIRKAHVKLNWKPKRTLRDMCAHSWKWQSKYPMGYRTLPLDTIATTTVVSNGVLNDDLMIDDVNDGYKPVTNGKVNAIKSNSKLINGKGRKAMPEVNNNDENVSVYQ